MKIEVTFDKGAKQKFKEQCIQRLQKFVQEIKVQQQITKGLPQPIQIKAGCCECDSMRASIRSTDME